jgi:methionine aminopeptidase
MEHIATRLRDMDALLAVLVSQADSLARDIRAVAERSSEAPFKMAHAANRLRDIRRAIEDITTDIECEAAVAALPADATDEEYNDTCERFSRRRAA